MYDIFFNFIFQGLAVWAICCLAKAVLDFIPLKNNPLQKLLNHIASPILKVIGLITPNLIPQSLHIFFAAIWLLVARVAFYLGAGAYGFLP